MTNNITLVLLYPGTRPQKLFRSRVKCWHWLFNIYEEVHEIIPDDGHDTGFRELARIKSYAMLTSRLSDDKRRSVLHLRTVLKNTGTESLITLKVMPLT